MPIIKFDYNESINGKKNARIGQLATKLSAIIEESSANMNDQHKLTSLLYKEATSDSATETLVIEDGYGLMSPTVAGNAPKTDKTTEIGQKVFMHIPFGKHIFFTEQMIEDSKGRLSPAMSVKAKELPRAYYNTKETIAQLGYINAENDSMVFDGAKIDLTTYDGKPLFSAEHTYGHPKGHAFGTQSNLFYVVNADPSAGDIAEYLAQLAVAGRQMLNANGDPQGFNFDTLILPGGVRSATLQSRARSAIGSQYFPGTPNNDINTQNSQWNLGIMPLWDRAATDDALELIVISQEAKDQMKSMWYNRRNLTVNVWKDDLTGNLNYRGSTRFGLGHADYKHAIKLKIFKTAPANTSGMTAL